MLKCIITFSILPKFGTYVINRGRGIALFILLGFEVKPTQKHSDITQTGNSYMLEIGVRESQVE